MVLDIARRGAFLLIVACVPACAAPSPEGSGIEEENNLGRAQQTLCFGGPGPRPTPVVVVPGEFNAVTSGTYDYGDGGCDGYVVKFIDLRQTTDQAGIGRLDGPISQSACEHTTVTIWMWARAGAAQWEYAGSASEPTRWSAASQTCVDGRPAVYYTAGVGPVTHQIITKVQARTEDLSGGFGYAYNRAVATYAN